MTTTDQEIEKTMALMESMRINRQTRRAAGAGTWVIGTIGGLRFEALVFPEHADCESYELALSRISKLWVGGNCRRTLYCWDRGLDVPAATPLAERVVDVLASGLAESVLGN